MKKIIVTILALGLLTGSYYYWLMRPNETKMRGNDNNQELSRTISLAEIEKHNNSEDCWLAIEGKVYDVTPYVKSGFHPGREAILMGCGKDATPIFNDRPNGSGAHSDKARNMLGRYLIGELTQ